MNKTLTPIEWLEESFLKTDGPKKLPCVQSCMLSYSKYVNAKLKKDIKQLNKELDIVHEAITELYQYDINVSLIKQALRRVEKLDKRSKQR